MAYMDELFGSNVFNDAVMQQRLPKDTYKALHKTIEEGKQLDPQIASVVANAMKDWAVEKGCTHYTHWFQPLTGITAEKHDSFISPKAGGKVILQTAYNENVDIVANGDVELDRRSMNLRNVDINTQNSIVTKQTIGSIAGGEWWTNRYIDITGLRARTIPLEDEYYFTIRDDE